MKYTQLLLIILFALPSCQNHACDYVCKPCGLACDEHTFNEPGVCTHCEMELVKASELEPEDELAVNIIDIQDGAGKYLIEGGAQMGNTITIHYYKPKALKTKSAVIVVLPGAGRNANEYRDAWIEKAEEYNVLVLAPEYSEKYYPEFWSYNLAGMISDVKINAERTAMTGFEIVNDSSQWIFQDFDRIFELAKKELNLSTNSYDLFGHSAGGQVLHRFALFNTANQANRILSSNSGWYTTPTDSDEFPTGLKSSSFTAKDIDFSKKLILFLGEKDDASETRGELNRSPQIDLQGLHRLARGTYFYNESMKTASELNAEFNWQIEIIPNIGHDYQAMSKAAADYLYATEK